MPEINDILLPLKNTEKALKSRRKSKAKAARVVMSNNN